MSRVLTRKVLKRWKEERKNRFQLERRMHSLLGRVIELETQIGDCQERESAFEAQICADLRADGPLIVDDRTYYVERFCDPLDDRWFDTLQVATNGSKEAIAALRPTEVA